MASGIYVALSGARAQSDALDSTSRNIANASTTGYKAERVSFAESLANAQSPDQRYVNASAPEVDLGQGVLRETGNNLDAAILGDGFFAIQTPQGERFTRDGSFRLNAEGQLVNTLGYGVLDPDGEVIELPTDAGDIEIGEDGEIYADGDIVADLKVAQFAKESLQREGDNMFRAIGPEIEDGELPTIVSESLEGSNFNTVRGVIDIVKVNRTFQALLKMVESYKETESRAARSLGGPK